MISSSNNKKNNFKKEKMSRGDLIFYCGLVAWPVIYFVVFYLGTNINAISLAFKDYDVLNNRVKFVGLENFKRIFVNFSGSADIIIALKNSLIAYSVGLVVGLTLSLLFAYYIYKKIYFHNFFKIILFLPSMISSMSLVVIFTYAVEWLLPGYVPSLKGLLSDPNTQFPVLLFFSIWVGFGPQMLIYIGAFSNIPIEVIEAGKIDGISPFREFWSIGLPLIYPTLSTFITVGIVGIFTNQLYLVEFFGSGADNRVETLGYFLFSSTLVATESEYPYLSAMGLLMTCVAAPVTFLARWLLKKYGPSVE